MKRINKWTLQDRKAGTFVITLFCVFVLIAFLFLPLPCLAEVNPDGSFTYTIPIEIPRGANGVQPNLALVYNSHARNGIVGVGWQLTGLPVITRINDGVGVKYDGLGSYAGPEGRLIDISGNRSLYHSGQEAWSNYIPQGKCGDGPCAWVVKAPDGRTLEFAQRGQGGEALPGAHGIRTWALSRFTDTNGNFYTLGYEIRNGVQYPKSITYTQGNGITNFRVITFSYELRPDHYKKYVDYPPEDMDWRLKWITVKTGVTAQSPEGILVRKYRLDYDNIGAGGRSRLIAVQEYGCCEPTGKSLTIPPFDSTGYRDTLTLLRPVTFSWSTFSGKFSSTPQRNYNLPISPDSATKWALTGDFNGDGKTDIFRQLANGKSSIDFSLGTSFTGNNDFLNPPTTTEFGPGGQYTLSLPADNSSTGGGIASWNLVGDFNGDGRADIFSQWDDTRCYIHYSNGDGKFQTHIPRDQQSTFCLPQSVDTGIAPWVLIGDFNADGKADLFVQYGSTTGTEGTSYVYFGTEKGKFQRITPGIRLKTSRTRGVIGNTFLGDFNGDGLADIYAQDGTLIKLPTPVAISDGINEPSEYYFECRLQDTVHYGNGDGTFRSLPVVDKNGPLAFIKAEVHLNHPTFATPQGHIYPLPSRTPCGYYNNSRSLTGDFNGDGRTDIFNQHPNGNGYVWLSIGDGEFWRASTVPTSIPYGSTHWNFVGDFNGDGLPDIYGQMKPNEGGKAFLFVNQGNGTFAPPISEGIPQLPSGKAGATPWNLLGDFNGDGMIDFFSQFDNNTSYLISLPSGTNVDVISQITNTLGGVTTVTYAPAPQVAGAIETTPSDSCTTGANPTCNISLASPRALVTRVAISNGCSGTTELQCLGGSYSSVYSYANGRMLTGGFDQEYYWNRYPDVAASATYGRGNRIGAWSHWLKEGRAQGKQWTRVDRHLGFRVQTIVNEQSGEREEFYYYLSRSLAGQLQERASYAMTGGLKSTTRYDYLVLGNCSLLGCVAKSHFEPSLTSVLSERADRHDPVYVPPSSAGPPRILYSIESTNTIDVFGNIERVATRSLRPNGTPIPETGSYAFVAYINDPSRPNFNPVVGLKKESRLCKDVSCNIVLQHEKFYYDGLAWGLVGARGLVTRKEGIVGQIIEVTTNEFDQFGNGTKTTFPNGTSTATTWDNVYHAYGSGSTDAQGFSTHVNAFDPGYRYGIPLYISDSNRLTTERFLDAFGRIKETQLKGPDGQILRKTTGGVTDLGVPTKQLKQACDWRGNLPYCETEYFDGLGRTYKITYPGEGGLITILKAFDAQGRPYRVSYPFYAYPGIWAEQIYDATGREFEIVKRTSRGIIGRLTPKRIYLPADVPLFSGAYTTEKVIDMKGRETLIWFDALQRPIKVTEGARTAAEATTSYGYHFTGKLNRVTDPRKLTTTIGYDAQGRIRSQTVPGMGTTTATYYESLGVASYGKLQTVTKPDPNGGSGKTTITYEYDNFGRQSRIISSDGLVTYTYGSSAPDIGSITKVTTDTDGIQFKKKYKTNLNGGKVAREATATLTSSEHGNYEYSWVVILNGLKEIEAMKYPNGEGLLFTYTAPSRKLDEIRLSSMTGYLAKYGYRESRCIGQGCVDASTVSGLPLFVTNANGIKTTYEYTEDEFLQNLKLDKVQSRLRLLDLSYSFDENFNIKSRVSRWNAAPSSTYTYDELDRLVSASTYTNDQRVLSASSGSHTLNYTYDVAGNRMRGDFAQVYDPASNRLMQWNETLLDWSEAGTLLRERTKRVNQQTGNSEWVEVQGYSWDSHSRLKTMSYMGQQKVRNYYDEAGQRFLKVSTLGGSSQTVIKTFYLGGSYEIREKWVAGVKRASQQTIYVRGADGNILASITTGDDLRIASTWFFGLIGFMSVLAGVVFFSHVRPIRLPFVREKLRQTSFTRNHTILAHICPVLLVCVGVHLFGVDVSRAALATDTSAGLPSGILYYHNDHLGSTTLVTDAQGTEVVRIAYDPYGQIDPMFSGRFNPSTNAIENAADAVSTKFTGQEYDPESFLYINGLRYYRPQYGVFISGDLGFGGGPVSQGLNRWAYATGNPIKYVDPSGNELTAAVYIAIILLAVLVTAATASAVLIKTGNTSAYSWTPSKAGAEQWNDLRAGRRGNSASQFLASLGQDALDKATGRTLYKTYEQGGWKGWGLAVGSEAGNYVATIACQCALSFTLSASYSRGDGYGGGVNFGGAVSVPRGDKSIGISTHYQQRGQYEGVTVGLGVSPVFIGYHFGKSQGMTLEFFGSREYFGEQDSTKTAATGSDSDVSLYADANIGGIQNSALRDLTSTSDSPLMERSSPGWIEGLYWLTHGLGSYPSEENDKNWRFLLGKEELMQQFLKEQIPSFLEANQIPGNYTAPVVNGCLQPGGTGCDMR